MMEDRQSSLEKTEQRTGAEQPERTNRQTGAGQGDKGSHQGPGPRHPVYGAQL
ncbi:MAG: hypothetical protein ACLTDI_12850 [Acutalibacteraceae bacterium]